MWKFLDSDANEIEIPFEFQQQSAKPILNI